MPNGPRTHRTANRAERGELAAIVFDLRIAGHTFRQIDTLTRAPDGPTGGHRISTTTAKEMVYEEAARRIDPRVDAWRALQAERLEAALGRLDELAEKAMDILRRDHITVSQGKAFHDVVDDGPALQALDRLVKIEEQRRRTGEALRRLLGLDAPVKVDTTITENSEQDRELQEMVNEYAARNARIESELRDGREHPQ